MAYTLPSQIHGLTVSGDFGPLTIYTDRFGKKVCYPKAPPDKPASVIQAYYRDRFKTSQANYMALSPQIKLDWENLVRSTSLCMTGQNLFIHISMKGAYTLLDTLIAQSGISVPAPPVL